MSSNWQHIITIDSGELELSAEALDLIKATIDTTLEVEEFGEIAEVSVAMVDKKEIQALNNLHRNKNSVTDVLSFIQYDDEGFVAYEDEAVFIGDIVICYQVALEQAQQYGHSLERELAYLTCHSCLHLLGYDHMTAEDKAEMRAREKIIMQKMELER